MKRRDLLKTIGGASVAAGAGAFTILHHPRSAHAGWGAWPTDDKMDALLDPGDQAHSVLELHVNGGMTTFDSFYTIPTWGDDDYRFLYVYSENSPLGQTLPASSTLEGRWAECNGGANLTQSFGAADTDGNEVHLGPWAYPLWSRPDVLDRMRIVVMAHDNPAHEGANPISFTGSRLGQPRMAGVGTAVQRYFTENAEAPGGGGVRAAPYSYVLYPAGYKPFNAVAASTVGFHPGSARPLVVSVDPNSELSNLLQRSALDNTGTFDDAVAYYRATYESRLKAFGHSTPARSTERDNYEFASFARAHATELTEILSDDLFAGIDPPGATETCGEGIFGNDMPAMQARMAASLLTREQDAARYVLWIDAGLQPSSTGGHDTHSLSVELNGLNLPHTLAALLDNIVDPANPRPGDENRINLDETMVVINTEFGRTPEAQGATGTNHHPEGYVSMYIGGPIQDRSVYGHMREADGFAQTFVRPAESRLMILQAMGIWGFSSQSYNVADVPGTQDELEAALRIRDVFLGYQG